METLLDLSAINAIGQIVGKLEMTIIALPFLILIHRRLHIVER